MAIALIVGGNKYERFTEIEVQTAFDSIAGAFSFSATSSQAKPLPFKGGENCTVEIDGILALTGTIDIVDVDSDEKSHSIAVQGRSLTSVIVDSSLDVMQFEGSISLQFIIQAVVTQLGANLIVLDESGGIDNFNAAEDDISPEIGQNAYEFIETLARKRQVLLTTNAFGNIVIKRSNPVLLDAVLQRLLQSSLNNIKRSKVKYDTTGRFRDYIFVSQVNTAPSVLQSSYGLSATVEQRSSAQDPDVAVGRRLVMQHEFPSSSDQCSNRAQWEGDIRRARSRIYQATVNGFVTPQGVLWAFDKLVIINDVIADVFAQLLINTVTFSVSIEFGSRTVLGFVNKDAYTNTLAAPASTDKFGEDTFEL